MEEHIDDSNAVDPKRCFVTTNQVKRAAKDIKVDAGSGKFLFNDESKMIGYDAMASTLMPNNLTKGTAANVCSAIILANWSRYTLANWGVKELIYDPYSRKKEGIKELTLNSFWDGVVTHPEAFAVVNDITTA